MAALRASAATLHISDLNKNLVRLRCFAVFWEHIVCFVRFFYYICAVFMILLPLFPIDGDYFE